MKQKEGEHPFGDLGQLICLAIFAAVWVGDSFFLHLSTFLAAYVPLYVRLIVLGLILGAAIYLAQSGHRVTGHEDRPAGVVTEGGFRYVRHPLYLASILAYLGVALSTLSLFSLAVVAGVLVFYDHIAGYEEDLLEARFDDDYRTYKSLTGKWVPKSRKEHLKT
jgi:protein-S-isoprenylcysteine O-methyltransferase Ste14